MVLTTGQTGSVTTEAFDVLGRHVAPLHEGPVPAGVPLPLAFDAAGLPAGVYVVRAPGDDVSAERRITVTR